MSKKLAHIVAVPNSRLAEIYNELADRPVKKFSDSSAAQRRTERLIAESGMVLVTADNGDGTVWLEPRDEFEASLTAPTNRKAGTSRKSVYDQDAPIDVNVGHNPKRVGSMSNKRFQILIDNPGITVAEYRAKTEEIEAGHGNRKALADLRWDEKHQYITVWTDELLASGDYDLDGFSEEKKARVLALRAES